MGKPNEVGHNPIKTGVRFVKKAGSWLYYEIFNQANVSDKMEWFDTEEKARARLSRGSE